MRRNIYGTRAPFQTYHIDLYPLCQMLTKTDQIHSLQSAVLHFPRTPKHRMTFMFAINCSGFAKTLSVAAITQK